MKIFVSHSLSDSELLGKIRNTIEIYGIELLIAEHVQDLENTSTEKIEQMIIESDIAILMLTENGLNSNFVQQEIGYIKSLKKPFLQLVQSGFENKISGFNYGRDFIVYDPENPEDAISKVKTEILRYWNEKKIKLLEIQKKKNIEKYRKDLLKKSEEEKRLKIGLGILAGVVVIGLLFGFD